MRSNPHRPYPSGEHDLIREVEYYTRDAVPFLLKQYDNLLEWACRQHQEIHVMGCEIDGLKHRLSKLNRTKNQ